MTHSNDNRRIPIIGDAVAPTGFARVIRSIFHYIATLSCTKWQLDTTTGHTIIRGLSLRQTWLGCYDYNCSRN